MPHGLSSPSVGMVKSTSVVGWPFVSTRAKLGRSWVNGPNSRPCSFIAAKFSPLIQIRSTVPPSVAARRLLGHHPRHRLGGVGELDVDQLDPEPPLQLLARPGEIVVDLPRAAPGVEVDGLAARSLGDLGEVLGVRRRRQEEAGATATARPDA